MPDFHPFTDNYGRSFPTLQDYLNDALGQFRPSSHGWLAWNLPHVNCDSATILTSGVINLLRVDMQPGAVINNITIDITTGGATLTAGQNLAGIYGPDGTRLGQTADQSGVWTSSGMKTMALTSPVTVPAGGFVYVAILSVGTTPPTLSRGFSSSSIMLSVNANLAAAAFYFANGPAGQTSLPASITLSANTSGSVTYWVAVS